MPYLLFNIGQFSSPNELNIVDANEKIQNSLVPTTLLYSCNFRTLSGFSRGRHNWGALRTNYTALDIHPSHFQISPHPYVSRFDYSSSDTIECKSHGKPKPWSKYGYGSTLPAIQHRSKQWAIGLLPFSPCNKVKTSTSIEIRSRISRYAGNTR